MIPSEIIGKKRDGINLSKKEIKWFIDSLLKNTGKVGEYDQKI